MIVAETEKWKKASRRQHRQRGARRRGTLLFRHCEPSGSGFFAGSMTGSAK